MKKECWETIKMVVSVNHEGEVIFLEVLDTDHEDYFYTFGCLIAEDYGIANIAVVPSDIGMYKLTCDLYDDKGEIELKIIKVDTLYIFDKQS